jgi:hypothetical protein
MVRLTDSLSGEDNMNKYLMMSAAAALVSTAAQAGTAVHSWTFGSAGGGSYCDGGTLYTNGSSIWAWRHTNNNCASGVSSGNGRVGKQGAAFKGADMSDNLIAKNYLSYFETINFLLPKKIKQGKEWELDVAFTGTTAFEGNSGPLLNVTPGAHGLTSHGKTSTTKALRTLLAVHRANKGQ